MTEQQFISEVVPLLDDVSRRWMIGADTKAFARAARAALSDSEKGPKVAALILPFYSPPRHGDDDTLTRYVISPEPDAHWKEGVEPPELTPVWDAYGQWTTEKTDGRFGVYLGGGMVLTFAKAEE